MKKAAWLCTIVAGLGLGMALPPATSTADVLIAAGEKGGAYHEIGRVICRLVNRHTPDIDCTALPTGGSRFNIANVRSGAYEFGLVSADVHYHAVNGSGPFAYVDESYESLRSVMSLPADSLTVLARNDSRISRFDELPGRRVNIGDPGSRQRSMMQAAMAQKGWTAAAFALAGELPADQQSLALCHGRFEAVVYAVGHPDAAVEQAVTLCEAILVGLDPTTLERLQAQHPYYAPVVIAGGLYPGVEQGVSSFGLRATLVTSADMPADMVHALVAAIGEQLAQLKRMHPLLAGVEPRTMAREALFAPLHEGALRYYRERGWVE